MRKLIQSATPPFIWNAIRIFVHWLRSRFYVQTREEAEYKKNNTSSVEGLFCLRPGLSFKIHPDCRIGFEYFCFRSQSMVAEMDSFLRITKGKKFFLDIGALHGIFSFAFILNNTNTRVIAVDASPLAFSRLLYNIHKNEIRNLLALECAVSDELGELHMQYEWEHLVAAKGAENGQQISISKKTGDAICSENCFEPEVIKIDVEGHEINVLRGLLDTIQKTRPIIFLEVHPKRISNSGGDIKKLIQLINEIGYRTYTVPGVEIETETLKDYEHDERFVLKSQ